MKYLGSSELLLLTSCLTGGVASACVPDYPERLLADPAVLQHPSVVAALDTVEQTLSDLYNTTRDALSFAVVSAPQHPPTTYTTW
jgi:hypothetical protein